MVQNLRIILRQFRKTPVFTGSAVLSLSLGIAGLVAVFSLIDAVFLRPLQFRNEPRLVSIFENRPALGLVNDTPAPANFVDWKARAHSFSAIAAATGDIFAVTGRGRPQQVEATHITANLLPVLGVKPLLGRNFRPAEDRPGAEPVALIGASLWQRRFASDPHVLNQLIRLNGVPYRIIGVMPYGFTFHEHSEIWTPLALSPAKLEDRDNHFLLVYGLLRPGVTVAEARQELLDISAQLQHEYPASNTGLYTSVVPLREQLVGNLRIAIFVLAAGVSVVLLLTWANIAGLMLARAAGRTHEMGIRAALGGTQARLFSYALTESLLLSAFGTALGIAFSYSALPLLQSLVPLSLAAWAHPEINTAALLLAVVICCSASLVFAFSGAPFRISELALALHETSRTITRKQPVRSFMVALQVALATIVLVATGLLGDAFWHLAHTDLGFRSSHVLTLRTELPASAGSRYENFQARVNFYTRVIDAVEKLPGVQSAGYTTFLPLTNGGGSSSILIDGAPPLRTGQMNDVHLRIVTPHYFDSLGVPLLEGRNLSRADDNTRAPVALINEAMARKYWPDEGAVGRHFRFDDPRSPSITVIGVVANMRQISIQEPPATEMYFSYRQNIGIPGYFMPRDLAIRTAADPTSFADPVRRIVWSIDPDQPISDVQPLSALVETRLAPYELQAKLFSWFSMLALLLSAVGTYGLIAYAVHQRTREIGVKMALGAQPSRILLEFIWQAIRLVVIGIAAGVLGSIALARLLESQFYGISASSAPVPLATILILAAALTLAAYLPASRAANIDPTAALRTSR